MEEDIYIITFYGYYYQRGITASSYIEFDVQDIVIINDTSFEISSIQIDEGGDFTNTYTVDLSQLNDNIIFIFSSLGKSYGQDGIYYGFLSEENYNFDACDNYLDSF